MCGIWAYLLHHQGQFNNETVKDCMSIEGRGPDDFHVSYYKNKYAIGFHRLSIMDPSFKGSQPFTFIKNKVKYTAICNGEIYNAGKLKGHLEYPWTSESDCETLIPLYLRYGCDMVQYLDGVFSFIIIEETDSTIRYFVARDRIGVRPLFIGKDDRGNYVFCSELKGMKNIAIEAEQFIPGNFMNICYTNGHYETYEESYYSLTQYRSESHNYFLEELTLREIREKLISSVKKRLISDRPVCALLSGGLDSSLVCSIASRLLKETNQTLYTFSIGTKDSPDNKYAQEVADFIGSVHTIVEIDTEQALRSVPDVIWSTETYDITTIRASVGQYLVSEYIAKHTDFKVVLSGDGSDEVTSGYLENYLAPTAEALHQHAVSRLEEIHYYDVLRADRATSKHGLEVRVPFLDVSFIDYYLNISPELRKPNKNRCEKYLLRKAFDNDYLPPSVLWRQKEAFSDGITSQENSWHSVLKRACDERISDDAFNHCQEKTNHPISKESYYYRMEFEKCFGEKRFDTIIPHFWMPKWSDTNDPSARTLSVYK